MTRDLHSERHTTSININRTVRLTCQDRGRAIVKIKSQIRRIRNIFYKVDSQSSNNQYDIIYRT